MNKSGLLVLFFSVLGFMSCKQDSDFRQKNHETLQSRSIEEDEPDEADEEENEIEIAVSALPQAVVDAISGRYAGASLKEADKITHLDGSITYDIEITFNGELIEVMYDEHGDFLGEESDND